MTGFETDLTGGLELLILVVIGLVLLLYLVPIPLWIAQPNYSKDVALTKITHTKFGRLEFPILLIG